MSSDSSETGRVPPRKLSLWVDGIRSFTHWVKQARIQGEQSGVSLLARALKYTKGEERRRLLLQRVSRDELHGELLRRLNTYSTQEEQWWGEALKEALERVRRRGKPRRPGAEQTAKLKTFFNLWTNREVMGDGVMDGRAAVKRIADDSGYSERQIRLLIGAKKSERRGATRLDS